MIAGREWHKKWEAEGRETHCLPEVFGGRALIEPKFEKETKTVKVIGGWIQLVGVFDVLEPTIGTDFKSGVMPATAYANGYQHKVLQILKPELKLFDYHSYDQYLKKVTGFARVHLTDKTLKEGIEFVVTNASDMRAYLEENNLIREPIS